MTDPETLVRRELQRDVPPVPAELRDWQDVLARSGESARRRLRRRLATAALAGAVIAALASTPLVGAIARGVGGFSDWLVGTPGEPVSPEAQRTFEGVTRFPHDPQLRQLLRLEVGGRRFFLYGFETGDVVCLRVAVRAPAPEGAQSACVSRDDLRRSGDLVLPVKANLGVEQVGPLPRNPSDPPTVPRYRLTFGLAAADVDSVTVETDDGRSAARVRNGAFLHVFEPGRRGDWARAAIARSPGRSDTVPLSVQAGGEPALATGLSLRGPDTVQRQVRGGTIGWFDRREARGVPARDGGLDPTRCCAGFVRVIHPDPGDFLAVAVGDRTLWARVGPRLRPQREEQICFGLVTRGTVGTGCRPKGSLFEQGPLSLSWGFSGSGQQIWIVHGLVSDDVARLRVFVGSGETWDAPLRDNATAFRVQRAKFPLRLVVYDREGRVVGIQSIRNG